jgi:hypothetical protein
MESESFSEDSRSPLNAGLGSEQDNLSSIQNKAQNGSNFITSEATSPVWRSLANLSKQEKIDIIQTGFQLNQEGKISLKKYYEDIGKNTLAQLRGYSINYETIRRIKILNHKL